MPMGGIKTIAIGDFYQLAPIPNKWTHDPGNYTFASPIWNIIFQHRYVFSHVHRQQNEAFIKAISETARGAVNLLMNLNGDERIFARRLDVHIANADCLRGKPGEIKVYRIEEGQNVSYKLRNSVDVPTQHWRWEHQWSWLWISVIDWSTVWREPSRPWLTTTSACTFMICGKSTTLNEICFSSTPKGRPPGLHHQANPIVPILCNDYPQKSRHDTE